MFWWCAGARNAPPMIGTLPEESGAPSQEKSEYILSPGQRKNESAASAHQPQGLAEPSSIEEYRGYSTNLRRPLRVQAA